MATKIYGSVNEDIAKDLTTRAVQSPYISPKVEDSYDRGNPASPTLWEWWKSQVTFISDDPEKPIIQEPDMVTSVKEAVSGSYNKVLMLTLVVAAIVVLPRILPVRR